MYIYVRYDEVQTRRCAGHGRSAASLRDLLRVVDFGLVNTECATLHTEETGLQPYEPALIFKMVGLQFLYDLSDRQVEEAASYNLLCKWFLGYAVHVLDKTAIAARVDLPPSTGHSGSRPLSC